MDARVTRLEVEFEHVRRDLDEIKADLKTVVATLGSTNERMGQLPTKRDLTNNTFAGLGIGLALMALIIGGIIGGLSWIRPDPSPVTPPPPVTITAPPPQIIYMQPPAPPSPAAQPQE